jgi:hypothetical protein
MLIVRHIRRAWLWLTAPKSSRRTWKTRDGRRIQIRSMSDGHLLNAWFWLSHKNNPTGRLRFLSDRDRGERDLMRECRRRGLDTIHEPEWLKTVNVFYPDVRKMKIAEKLLRPVR